MKLAMIFSILVLTAACSSSDVYRIVMLEDGQKGFVISCFDDRDNCEREADKLCKNHYKVHEFLYKQSVNTEVPNVDQSVRDENEMDDEMTSRFEMTVSCENPN